MHPMDSRDLDVDPADIPPTGSGVPPETPLRVLPAGCLFAFGSALVFLPWVVVLTVWVSGGRAAGKDELIGLTLVSVTGLLWIGAAWSLLRRNLTLMIIFAATAVLVGGIASYLYNAR